MSSDDICRRRFAYNAAVVKNDKIREFIKNRVECTADSIDEEKSTSITAAVL